MNVCNESEDKKVVVFSYHLFITLYTVLDEYSSNRIDTLMF